METDEIWKTDGLRYKARFHSNFKPIGPMTGNSKDILTSPEMNLIWQIHYLSSLVVLPVYPNITVPHDLPLIDWRVVMTLAHAPEMSAQEISDLWALDKMAVSRAVNSLLRRKLITRTADKIDRRRKSLALTDKGRVIFRKCWPAAKASYRKLTSALSDMELDQFQSISEKLIAEARQMVKIHLDRAARSK